MKLLPMVPYVHTTVAVGLRKNVEWLRDEPGRARAVLRPSSSSSDPEPADDMLRFVVRRLLLLVPVLVGLSILIFVWVRALPGTPADALLGERATPADRASSSSIATGSTDPCTSSTGRT